MLAITADILFRSPDREDQSTLSHDWLDRRGLLSTGKGREITCGELTADRCQLGFIIPLGAKPQQCHNAITPNDMYSDLACAFSGAFLLAGGFASILWGMYRFGIKEKGQERK